MAERFPRRDEGEKEDHQDPPPSYAEVVAGARRPSLEREERLEEQREER